MKQIYPDLWQTDLEMKFSSLKAHAYLLERPEGNVLIYTTRNGAELTRMKEHGPVLFHYLSHSHEVDDSLTLVRETLGAKLCCHTNVQPYLDDNLSADVIFSSPDGDVHSQTIEVISTPGHTNNNLCYAYRSPHGKTYLFTGDTIYLDRGKWKTIVFERDGGSTSDLIDSLKRLRSLPVDVILCSVAVGDYDVIEVTTDGWHAIMDSLISELEEA